MNDIFMYMSYVVFNNGKYISSQHIWNLYKKNQGANGHVLLPKLTLNHVKLTSYSKMSVRLAAQVNFRSYNVASIISYRY